MLKIYARGLARLFGIRYYWKFANWLKKSI